MNASSALICLSVSLLLQTVASAGDPPKYSAFSPQERPKLFPLQELVMLRLGVFGLAAQGRRPAVEMVEFIQDDDGTSLDVLPSAQTGFDGTFRVSRLYAFEAAFLGDFNRDTRNDVAVIVSSGGNGIASCICDVAFLLSGPREPTPLVVNSQCASRHDFVDLFKDGRCQFIQTSFIFGYGEPGRDGREHNYWVYSIVRVETDKLVLDNSLLPGFPKWVMYTFKPNSTATNQLTDVQKNRLGQQEERRYIGPLSQAPE